MLKHLYVVLLFSFTTVSFAQQPNTKSKDSVRVRKDSIRKTEFLKSIGNGFIPLGFFDLDLRYLVKFNQYEGLRTGLGGVTNDRFSDHFRINGYFVYGFVDKQSKYSIGGGFRVNKASNTWVNLSYTDDLEETGSSNFLTDTAKLSLQWSPFSTFDIIEDNVVAIKDGYPKFSLQFTKGFRSVFGSDFNFSKIDFRTVQQFNHKNKAVTNITLVGGIAGGDTPLTHLYHAYPNNIRKETILQRFSVAGLNSFETMYFNEFFSDKFSTLQLKHKFRPFKFSDRIKPELVLITRYAIGNMESINRHQGVTFKTLEKLYSESGFEINKLFFGFGLSFAYRYGGYHLPNFGDNIAFKFTFNLSL